MSNNRSSRQNRIKRSQRVRAKMYGTVERPRISVHRSNQYFYCQAIIDLNGKTVASIKSGLNPKQADVESLGKDFAEQLKKAKVTSAIYDRGGFAYQGKVAAFAEGLRAGGINI